MAGITFDCSSSIPGPDLLTSTWACSAADKRRPIPATAASATRAEGAIYNDRGTVALINSTVSYHTALGGDGEAGSSGAVGGDGGNGSAGRGGAIFNLGGTVVITNSVFMGNSVNGGMGGNGVMPAKAPMAVMEEQAATAEQEAAGPFLIPPAAQCGSLTALFPATTSREPRAAQEARAAVFSGMNGLQRRLRQAMGGSIFNENGTVTIMNCTFYTNTATGAVGNDGKAGSGDRDGVNGTEGSTAFGGGIFNSGGALIVTNGTFGRMRSPGARAAAVAPAD